MPWWLGLIASLGIPALKLILKFLEIKYPGISPFVDAIISFLDGGGKVADLQKHFETCPGFCAVADVKKE